MSVCPKFMFTKMTCGLAWRAKRFSLSGATLFVLIFINLQMAQKIVTRSRAKILSAVRGWRLVPEIFYGFLPVCLICILRLVLLDSLYTRVRRGIDCLIIIVAGISSHFIFDFC